MRNRGFGSSAGRMLISKKSLVTSYYVTFLIIGDRKKGKTAVAIDAIINQKFINESKRKISYPPQWYVYILNNQEEIESLFISEIVIIYMCGCGC